VIKKLKPYYSIGNGAAYLGNSLELMSLIPDNSINLIITSPPFALTSKKEYGNKDVDDYIDWFLKFAREFRRILTEDGSFVLDLGGSYQKGAPVRNIYQFELLIRLVKELKFFLAQEFYHYNPARLPAPAEWVNVRRIRVKDSVNVVWWLSKSEYPKADNRNVLKPYTEAMKKLQKNGYKAKKRPSGHDITNKFMRKNKGAIPPNVLRLGNNDSNSSYMRKCKEAGIKPHPARFPSKFAEFFIRFLTNENDVVFDPFAGSNTTGFVAEKFNRRWIAMELVEEYLKASMFRFEDNDSEEEENNKLGQMSLFTPEGD
jgi:site-specific DNA-methyltransferase (cytosine-N4-specific)